MNANGLTLYNAGTSLDLDALAQANAQNNRQNDEHEDSDDGDEEEIQQRNAELRNMLTNAFDDLIEEDDTDFENTADGTQYSEPRPNPIQPGEVASDRLQFLTTDGDYRRDSLYSPLHEGGDLSTTHHSINNNSPPKSVPHKSTRVRFSQIEDVHNTHSYRLHWTKKRDEMENEYLSSGLNSKSELEILYAARGSEISKLGTQIHELQHKVALLEGEKTGLTVTLQNSEQVLRDCRDENACLKDEIASLNERLLQMTEVNRELTAKMNSADNKIISLERQILDMNMFQANQRDANRQEVLFSSIKTRYENDLRGLRDELTRLRTELETKNESLATCERKLREVTEMHERTLMERAANLQEFNRALDQQRQLREQRDTLTSAALLEQLSKAKEEIDRLKAERVSQALSDSMAQLRIGKERDIKQMERLISNLEQRLEAADKKVQSTEETLHQLQQEKKALSSQLVTLSDSNQQTACEREKLLSELDNVKELYLKVCQEKDLLEEHVHQMSNERADLDAERKLLLKDLEDSNRHAEETVQRHLATLETNFQAKLEIAVKESVARARLEWIKEQAVDESNQNNVHVEKSMGELQCLRETMDALRHERDQLQSEAIKKQQQIKLERHLLLEKFKIEKEMINKSWDDRVAAMNEKLDSIQKNDELMMATVQEKFKVEKEMLIKNWQDKVTALESKLECQGKTDEAMRTAFQEQLRVEKELLTKSLQDKVVALEAKLETEELMKTALQEKFKIEKEKLIKSWQDKVTLLEGKLEDQEKSDELMKATADAMTRLRQQCEDEKLLIINNYEKQISDLQSNASTPIVSSSVTPLGSTDWKVDMSKIKASLKVVQVPAEVLISLESVVQKVDALFQRDLDTLQRQTEKYRNLKRRVRDYQKYATDKLTKYKAEKQRSEDYCRNVITELLEKVSNELRQCQSGNDQRNANVNPVSRAVISGAVDEARSSDFVQTIDDLQREVNQYILGLTNFNSNSK